MKARLAELMAAMAFVPPNVVTSMSGREKGEGRRERGDEGRGEILTHLIAW